MCGIIGYLGQKPALPVLLEGLKRLEYRGYDSAGLCLLNDHGLQVRKAVGRIAALETKVLAERNTLLTGSVGLAHTRWATHGAPSEVNAHPHLDMNCHLAVVHNGIIENHTALRKFLEDTGVRFSSQTDTEVLSHLIAYHLNGGNGSSGTAKASLLDAVLLALAQVVGTFGMAVLSLDHPGRIVAARRGSPLLIGIGKDEYILASDAAAIIAHTSNVIYLEDNEAVELSEKSLRTVTLDAMPVQKSVEQIALALEEIELGGYPHRMLKEIHEQPESLQNCLRGRIDPRSHGISFGGLERIERELVRTHRFIIAGCGTAWHAAMVGAYLMEDLARIFAEPALSSELRYRNPIVEERTTFIAVSQSGETADTLGALREVREKGALALGVVNAVGSTIARATDAGVYLHAGPEIGVASTKAFTAQVAVLTLLSLWMGRRRHLSFDRYVQLLDELGKVPALVREVLAQSARIAVVAQKYAQREDWLFLGRGYHYPVALEGALKLKEISYIHAEGLSASEMKHGHIALVTPGMPVVAISPQGSQYDKMLSNIQEVKARGAHVIAVGTRGDKNLGALAEDVLEIPAVLEPLQPLLAVVPLQLLAYHTASLRGCNIDRPRNLAKSVTVE